MNKRKKSLILKIDENYKPAIPEEGEEYFPNGYFVAHWRNAVAILLLIL